MEKILDSIMNVLSCTEADIKNKLQLPSQSKAIEVCVLLDAALQRCNIPPSAELFCSIFDRIYPPQPSAEERQADKQTIKQTIDKVFDGLMGVIANRSEEDAENISV